MTNENHDRIREELLKNDTEFRALHDEHQECESRLNNLEELGSDEGQIKAVKLHKLTLKDRMEAMIRQHDQ